MHRDTDELLGVGDSLPAAERYRARALLALNAVVLLVGLFVGAVAVATFVLVHEQVQAAPQTPEDDHLNLGRPINLYWAKKNIIAYRSGGQYDDDMNALTAQWWAYFKGRAVGPNDTVVFDIDDTVLSSYPEMVSLDFAYIAKFDQEFQEAANASAIPQTQLFYNQLLEKGYKIVFLTGRREPSRPATKLNLERQKFGTYSELILRAEDEYALTAQVYKSNERAELVKKGYKIVGAIGDQWSDISGNNVGYRMKVINHCYYIA